MAMVIVACFLPSMSAMRFMLARPVLTVIVMSTLSSVMASSGLLAVGLTAVTIIIVSLLPRMTIAWFPAAAIGATMFMFLSTIFRFLVIFIPGIARAPRAVMIFLVGVPSAMMTLVLVTVRTVPIRSLGLVPTAMVMRRWITLRFLAGLSTGFVATGRHSVARAADTMSIRLVP